MGAHWNDTEVNTFASFLKREGVKILEIRRYMSGDVEWITILPAHRDSTWFEEQIKRFDRERQL